jgi:hypothetical protein
MARAVSLSEIADVSAPHPAFGHSLAGGEGIWITRSPSRHLDEGASKVMTSSRAPECPAALLLIAFLANVAISQEPAKKPGQPSARASTFADPRNAAPNQERARHAVTMAGGFTFEVIAISSFPSGPKTWWRPDGSPIDDAPADRLPYPYSKNDDEEVRVILARADGLSKDATLKWMPAHDSTYFSTVPTQRGKKVPGLEVCLVAVRKDRTTGEVEVKLASDAWKTEASDPGRGGRSMVVDRHKFDFGKARAVRSGMPRSVPSATSIAVAHNLVDSDHRLIAIDSQGNEHTAYYWTASAGGVLGLLDAEFPLAVTKIREFQVQSRPFERAVIKNIALQPRPAEKPGATKAAAAR